MIQIETENLTAGYGGFDAVKNVSIKISRGEYICLIGSNGSGKSTLIKALLGLLPYEGKIVRNIPPESIGYMPQIPLNERDFPATAAEIVLSGSQRTGRRLPFYTSADKAAARAVMENLKISDLSDKRINELSGGQLQRVYLCRTLIKNPELLIMDEPCASLDPQITGDFMEVIGALNKNGTTVFMCSHDLHEVEAHAKRVIAINRSVSYDGPTSGMKEGRHD